MTPAYCLQLSEAFLIKLHQKRMEESEKSTIPIPMCSYLIFLTSSSLQERWSTKHRHHKGVRRVTSQITQVAENSRKGVNSKANPILIQYFNKNPEYRLMDLLGNTILSTKVTYKMEIWFQNAKVAHNWSTVFSIRMVKLIKMPFLISLDQVILFGRYPTKRESSSSNWIND